MVVVMILLISPNGEVGDDGENEKCKTVQIYVLEILIIMIIPTRWLCWKGLDSVFYDFFDINDLVENLTKRKILWAIPGCGVLFTVAKEYLNTSCYTLQNRFHFQINSSLFISLYKTFKNSNLKKRKRMNGLRAGWRIELLLMPSKTDVAP